MSDECCDINSAHDRNEVASAPQDSISELHIPNADQAVNLAQNKAQAYPRC